MVSSKRAKEGEQEKMQYLDYYRIGNGSFNLIDRVLYGAVGPTPPSVCRLAYKPLMARGIRHNPIVVTPDNRRALLHTYIFKRFT